MNSHYAIAKLIEAMGMLVHDLWELKCGNGRVYTEDAYYRLSDKVMDECDERKAL